MAKFTYTKFLGDFGNLRFIFDEETLKLDSQHSSKSATFTDRNGGEHIVLSGSGLTYSKGGISGGEVDKITFENKHGDAMLTVTDGHWSASQITHMLTGKDGVEQFLDKIMAGKDTVKGSDRSDFLSGGAGDDKIDGGKGNDEIYGGKGNDHLHGGAGSDHFEFSPGRDVIDDFDASGGGMKQDHIVGNFDDVHFHQSGADLVLTMDDGSSLVLLHTKMSAISAADFELF